MLGATRWVVMGAGIGHVLRLGSNLILTRLLMPEMFGLMSIATTVGVIMVMLADIGLRQAVIRSPRGDEGAFLNTAWSMQVVQGFVLWGGSIIAGIILYVASALGWVSAQNTYGDPLLPWLIASTGIYAAINGMHSTLALSSTRHFDLSPIYKLDVLGQVLGLMVVIPLALWTGSIWSLVAGSIASISLSVILSHLWMQTPRNVFEWEPTAAREIFNFGKWLAVSSAVTVFAANGDRLMLAAYSNAALLGLYSISSALVSALDSVLNQLFDRVMLPAFSEVARNNPKEIPRAYFRLRWKIDPIILGFSGLLFGSASSLIAIMYDSRYSEAGNILQILSIGMIVSRYNLVQQVYLAIGQTQYFVWLNIVRLVSTFTLIPLGYYFGGFYGSLVAAALRNLPSVLLTFHFNSKHSLNNIPLELKTSIFWIVGYLLARGMHWLI